ncbi:hypothetical protein ASC74_08140 [Pseudomonas sp. Root329]|uniref:Crp/Fnr family transcriptional regulator n=1 Tax=Pseudomonas sp. Root329 TaxID=1736515 RepID=UPI0006F89E7E|nr:Crp/Fnr family transcriptional regulator [Pseudomonas sp. Root329]KQV13058.1 hypothetical protein ASC74_08140 [Pseudomonas sp. Root329]
MKAPNPKQNHLLAALPAQVQSRLLRHLELVTLPLGNVLYESGDTLRHVYFPTDAIVSLLCVMGSGATAEISVVGNEGMIGVAVFMGGESTPSSAIVQSAGHAYRLPRRRLKDEFNRHGDMLGVRRESVNEAAGKLQRQGVIEYSRGHFKVIDRVQLEQLSCECYAVVKNETERLLPYLPAHQHP